MLPFHVFISCVETQGLASLRHLGWGILVTIFLFFFLFSSSPVSAWWFFSSDGQQMNESLCKSRAYDLPIGVCCDKTGKMIECGADDPNGSDPNDPQPGEGNSLPDAPADGGSNSVCYNGSGYCGWDALKKYFNTDTVAAGRASGICQRESHSNPASMNKSCLTGGSDYSIGLFQINLLGHCSSYMLNNFSSQKWTGADFNAQSVFQYTMGPNGYPVPVSPCQIINKTKLDLCEAAMINPEYNIRYAADLSGRNSQGKNIHTADWKPGQSWGSWSTWSGLDKCEKENPGGGGTTLPPSTSEIAGCPDSSQRISVPGTTYQHLNHQHTCVKPKMVVIHWSASWSSTQVTFNTLNTRDRSCQLAADDTSGLQMLDFYPDTVQQGWCVGGQASNGTYWNDVNISIEITGSYFDDIVTESPAGSGTFILNPAAANYDKLKASTDRAMQLTCWSLKQYHIATSEVYGHFDFNTGKPKKDWKQDPGVEYMKYFKQRVANECK